MHFWMSKTVSCPTVDGLTTENITACNCSAVEASAAQESAWTNEETVETKTILFAEWETCLNYRRKRQVQSRQYMAASCRETQPCSATVFLRSKHLKAAPLEKTSNTCWRAEGTVFQNRATQIGNLLVSQQSPPWWCQHLYLPPVKETVTHNNTACKVGNQ